MFGNLNKPMLREHQVPSSTQKYLQAPKITTRYPKVPPGTQKCDFFNDFIDVIDFLIWLIHRFLLILMIYWFIDLFTYWFDWFDWFIDLLMYWCIDVLMYWCIDVLMYLYIYPRSPIKINHNFHNVEFLVPPSTVKDAHCKAMNI